MKTRNALFALCLPLAFAACQNEELADLGNQSSALKDRGVVDVTITAARPNASADTRMSSEWAGTNLNFLWEKGTDKLGAALMDEETSGTVKGEHVYVNNPFIAQNDGASAEFKSPSSLTKGIYLFYNQYQDVLDRGELKLVMGTQVYNPADTKTAEQQMASYMKMIAPMVNLNDGVGLEAAESFTLPLQFVNLYTPVKVPVVFKNAPEGTKLTQIRIDAASDADATAANHFVLGNAINPANLAGTKSNNQYKNVLALKDGAIDESKVKMADAIAALDEIVQKGKEEGGIFKDADPTYGPAVLNIKDGDKLENGVAKDYWVLIPRGKYAKLYINIETSNGNMTELVKTIPAPAEGEDDLQKFDDKYRKVAQVEVDFANNVSQPTEFTINSGDDWTRYTKYVMDHVTSYIGRDIVFELGEKRTVYVTSMPQFGFTLKNAAEASLVLGNKDKSAATISADFSGVTMDGTPTVVVGDGATVTWAKPAKDGEFNLVNNGTLKLNASDANATIINSGSVEVNARGTIASLTNDGDVNINAEVTIEELTNSVYDEEEDATYRGTITVKADAVLTMAASTENSGNIVIEKNGELANAGNFTNNWLINNYGKLSVKSGSTYANSKTLRVQDGSFSSGGGEGTITNSGVVEIMNPVTFKDLQASKKYVISGGKMTAVVSNRAAFLAAKSINMNITLGGGEWTLKESVTGAGDAERVLNANDFTSEANGNAITSVGLQANLTDNFETDLSSVAITASGSATISCGKDKTLRIKSLEVNRNVAVTIASGAKVLVTASSANTLNGKITNNGVLGVVGTASVTDKEEVRKATLTVGSYGELVNNNVLGGETNSAFNVSVSGKMTNTGKTVYGTITLNNPKEYKGGVSYDYAPVVTTAGDLKTAFPKAKSIESKAAEVTTLPQDNVNVKLAAGTSALNFNAAANYTGTVTVAGDVTIGSTAEGVVINKIAIEDNCSLTVKTENAKNITVKSITGITETNLSNRQPGKLVDEENNEWAYSEE